MKIYLMRHGEASFDAPTDDLRELTQRGRDKVEYNIEQKKEELSEATLLLSSPILRARQTAEIAKTSLGFSQEIEQVDWLVHGSDPAAAVRALSEIEVQSLILFSHQPFVTYFIVELCGEDGAMVAMNTASIVGMDVDPVAAGFGQVRWHLN